jgi:hypothetical protein
MRPARTRGPAFPTHVFDSGTEASNNAAAARHGRKGRVIRSLLETWNQTMKELRVSQRYPVDFAGTI